MESATPRRRSGDADFLKEKEEEYRADPDAQAGEDRVVDSRHGRGLIPTSGKPQIYQIQEDREGRGRFDHETAEPVADTIGGELGENLVRAVKDRGHER